MTTTAAASAPPSVLVVEDDADVRRLLQAHLERLGWEVRVAATGERGVELALERVPDVAVVDIVLPGLDGHGVVRALRGCAATRGCAVVLTTMLEPGDLAGADADAVLPKPFTRADVARVLAPLTPAAQELS